MFDIPQRYITDSPIAVRTFITQEMKRQEKEKVRENMLLARLMWQITGEEIPSLINENYNCSVIMGLEIKLKSVKDAVYFTGLIQQMTKAPCVIRIYDQSEESYSFALKRLNLNDNTQVVLEDKVLTPPTSLMLPDKTAQKLRQYLSFGELKNKTDKLGLYLEATVKAFIISNLNLYSGLEQLLDSKLWYNRNEVLSQFGILKELMRLNAELKTEKLPGEKAKIIGSIKTLQMSIKGE